MSFSSILAALLSLMSPAQPETPENLLIGTPYEETGEEINTFDHLFPNMLRYQEPEEVTEPEPEYQTAMVSFYGKPPNMVRSGETDFNNRYTASGRRYHYTDASIAAHRDLPFGTIIEMRHRGQVHRVTVYDRGPCHGNRQFDVSWAAAGALGFRERGVAEIEWRVVELGDRDPPFRCPTRGLLYG